MLSVWHKADIYRIPIYAPVTLRSLGLEQGKAIAEAELTLERCR